ncbi:unnamed protein product [Brassica rapa subsp. trilocularis]
MGDPNLPHCIFSSNKEPSGERSIFEELDSEELAFLRNSTFAKVLILDDNPPFFDAFGHFVLVRRLKTNKKFKIWILFAWKPNRFSLS